MVCYISFPKDNGYYTLIPFRLVGYVNSTCYNLNILTEILCILGDKGLVAKYPPGRIARHTTTGLQINKNYELLLYDGHTLSLYPAHSVCWQQVSLIKQRNHIVLHLTSQSLEILAVSFPVNLSHVFHCFVELTTQFS